MSRALLAPGDRVVSDAGMLGTVERKLPVPRGSRFPVYRVRWENGTTSVTRAISPAPETSA